VPEVQRQWTYQFETTLATAGNPTSIACPAVPAATLMAACQ